ncbi:MAG: alpha/beta hydrolase [Steroidobacteraceae bacterium]
MIPPRAEPLTLAGSAGVIEALIEDPAASAAPAACMVACHPHPLHGGTMHNKVVTTLVRAANELGMPALRFNYRGVGASAGSFDEGRGEMEDVLTAVSHVRQRWPHAALWLAGFSFGGHMALRASMALGAGAVARLITVAPAITRHFGAPQDIKPPDCPWLVVQGDADEVIEAADVIDWCRRIQPPPQLVVLPGVGHFFHGQLNALKDAALAFLK